MKYQQVSVNFMNMVFTAFSYLALAGAAWIFLRLLQACFWLPRHLQKQNNVQQMLQEKVDSYEKYLLECEEKEKNEESGMTTSTTTTEPPEEISKDGKTDNRTNEEKWKERRECLEMLKRELKRVKDGGDIYDWDYLLEEDEKLDDGADKTELNEAEDTTTKKEVSTNDVDCEIVENSTKSEETIEKKKEK